MITIQASNRAGKSLALSAILLCGLVAAPVAARAATASSAGAPITIVVDAREAPRHLLHARMTFPAQAGPMTLAYPKWLPGEHGPTGPLVDIVGLTFKTAGKTIPWKRGPQEVYEYHLEVPEGAAAVEANLDFAMLTSTEGFSSGGSSTANLLVLSWNQVLLYPAGPNGDDILFAPSLILPDGWQSATALEASSTGGSGGGDRQNYKQVSLTTLVDSPVLAGRYFRTVPLSPSGDPHPARLNIAADSAAALDAKPEVLDRFKRLVAEEMALFGARHYRKYDFLLTLSDHTAHFGLEHHESSDDRVPERFLVDPDVFFIHGDLLAHEMTHSWNGKYRRPRGLQTNDYRQPIDSSLLWVYEGLTNYYGEILAARSGLWTPEQARDQIAWQAARLATQPGRSWRPIEDTGTAAQILYDSSKAWESARRTVDFYEEGTLIWLEADSLIREKTNGQKSLDDFARAFHGGGQDTVPEVKWYDAKEVYDAMNAVVAYDWKTFFEDRIVKVRPEAPTGGLERDGWRLSWTETKPPLLLAKQEVDDVADERFSLGFLLRKDALIEDVLPGSPAAKAGIAPSETLLAVNGRKFERRILEAALQDAKGTKTPIELLTENGEFFQTFKVDWHGGERYPVLERMTASPDRLSDVMHARAGS